MSDARKKTKLSAQQKKINRRLKAWVKSEDVHSGVKPNDTIIVFKSELSSIIDKLAKLNEIINKTVDEWDIKSHQSNCK